MLGVIHKRVKVDSYYARGYMGWFMVIGNSLSVGWGGVSYTCDGGGERRWMGENVCVVGRREWGWGGVDG